MPKTIADYPSLYYHRVNEEGMVLMERIRCSVLALGKDILATVPEGRQQSLAMTHLENVSRCAIAGLALAYGDRQKPVGFVETSDERA